MKQTDHFNIAFASMNKKTGNMPVTFSPRSTCPDACPLKANGCYASSGRINLVWGRVDRRETGWQWPEFIRQLSTIERGRIWRFATTGDLPGTDDKLDADKVMDLVRVNYQKMGFAYTHFSVTKTKTVPQKVATHKLKTLRAANDKGFIVNLSANSMEHADRLAPLGLPLVCLVPETTPDKFTTPGGLQGVVCPAQTRGLTCRECKLCAQPARATHQPGTAGCIVVGFKPHGAGTRKATQVMAESV